MTKNYRGYRPASYNTGRNQQNGYTKALTDITSSDKPGKWVTGVGLGALAIAGLAIKAIVELSDKR